MRFTLYLQGHNYFCTDFVNKLKKGGCIFIFDFKFIFYLCSPVTPPFVDRFETILDECPLMSIYRGDTLIMYVHRFPCPLWKHFEKV